MYAYFSVVTALFECITVFKSGNACLNKLILSFILTNTFEKAFFQRLITSKENFSITFSSTSYRFSLPNQ